METQPIPLSSSSGTETSTVYSTTLFIFKLVRKVGAAAAEVPDALQASVRDVASAWADSRPKS